MEELLKNLTNTELLKIINDTTLRHDTVKSELITLIDQIDEKTNELTALENDYVMLINEMTKRSENVIREETSS